ncbi:hypothetical protein [Lunatibacter salilacus]|uniref:hypothetical protein n=1 Tax=Lunatibacter salilacus TaxID=2483804 RepID=UPI00131D9961|nr:hypothetical protein [Lunatibacter salilacus]
MDGIARNINPFTDFGFKKLFGEQVSKEGIQEKIFAKVMDIAELVNLDKKVRKAYEESLKHYRDLKNALDSSEAKGEAQGREMEKRNSFINFYKAGVSVETISQATQLDIKAVKAILTDSGILE